MPNTAITIFTIIVFALLNRARGSRLFDETNSTTISRALSMWVMAIIAGGLARIYGGSIKIEGFAIFTSWTLLMLWCSFAWDNYWSAAIGNPTDITKKAFAPVDWIMGKLPPMPLRLWGTVAMGLRQMLLAPFLIFLAVSVGNVNMLALCAAPILFGVPYLIAGFLPKQIPPIAFAELVVGGCIGLLVALLLIHPI